MKPCGMHIYSTRGLRNRGLSAREISRHVASGRLVRVRRGVYAAEDADPTIIEAARIGGRLTCVSALAHSGAWAMPFPDIHVRVASGVAVSPGSNRRLHWTHERLDDTRWSTTL